MTTASLDDWGLDPAPAPSIPLRSRPHADVAMEQRSSGSRPPEGATLEERALRGDSGAWNALVRKYNQRVVVALLGRGVRLDRAKDLAQDTWLRLIEQQRQGRLSRLQLPGLAVAQAVFFSLEASRRDRRAEPQADEWAAATLADPAVGAEAKLLAGEQLARAAKVLSTCSPSARRVFHLVYGGQGLSHAEVAKQVGLSLQRVRQIVCEVREVLRTAVDVEGVHGS